MHYAETLAAVVLLICARRAASLAVKPRRERRDSVFHAVKCVSIPAIYGNLSVVSACTFQVDAFVDRTPLAQTFPARHRVLDIGSLAAHFAARTWGTSAYSSKECWFTLRVPCTFSRVCPEHFKGFRIEKARISRSRIVF